jgi:hypothetical protein
MMSGIQRIVLLSTVATLLLGATATQASPKAGAKEEFPKFETVSKDYVEVISTADGAKPFYRVWKRDKDAQLLAELPGDYQSKKFFVVPTVAGGDSQLGVYSIWHYLVGKGARYLHWKRYDKKLALLEPNLAVRTLGDAESKLATQRIYTDTVVLTAPIVCMGPGGGPVIDLDQVLLQNSGKFFGRFTAKADFGLTKIESAKAFPYNLELTLSFPRVGGQLARIHYSIGTPPPSPGYKPREADRRVGIYYVDFIDRAKYDTASPKRRYVERWHLEKADPSLKLSPPKQPIIYYIEHTTPIRYRRWVRDGILAWNRAFEQVGLLNAIEVYQQDATTGAHMDKDPEDLRYSFVRWTNAGMGFAIGPSHTSSTRSSPRRRCRPWMPTSLIGSRPIRAGIRAIASPVPLTGPPCSATSGRSPKAPPVAWSRRPPWNPRSGTSTARRWACRRRPVSTNGARCSAPPCSARPWRSGSTRPSPRTGPPTMRCCSTVSPRNSWARC